MMYQRKFKHWKTKKIIINYRCEKCNKNISKNKIENYVFEELLNLDELTELNEINNLNLDTRITTLNQMIERLDKEREKLINLYTKGLISDEEIEIKLNGIDKEKSNLRHELDEIEKLVSQHTYDSCQNNNLQILKEVILNRNEDDIKDLKNLFKLMIKRIDILNTNPLDVIISLI